jgi:hypothetical protein
MDKEKLKGWLEKGTEITGAAVGGALGLIGGPVGAVLGGVVGTTFAIAVKDMIGRQLSNRQEMRVAASASYILTDVQQRLANGGQVRQDAFFDSSNGRSSAEELFEGVLLKCKDEYQEKKIHYISKIFEKAAFDTNISAESANQVLTAAESFTYHKLCVIAFFGRKQEFDESRLMSFPYSYYGNAVFSTEIEILKQDVFEMMNFGLLDNNNTATFTRHDIIPGKFQLTQLGQLYFSALELQSVPKAEIEAIYEGLVYKAEFGEQE